MKSGSGLTVRRIRLDISLGYGLSALFFCTCFFFRRGKLHANPRGYISLNRTVVGTEASVNMGGRAMYM